MTRLAELVIVLAALGCVACTDHQRRVESVPQGRVVQVGRPLRSTLRAYVVLWPATDGLLAEARVQSSCPTRELTLLRDEEITEITAAQSRWAPAAVCAVLGGTFLATGKDYTMLAVFSLGAGFVVAAAPMIGERTKREPLGLREQMGPGSPVTCDDRPLSEVTLTLRAGTTTVEAMTDVAGRARFAGVAREQVRLAYIDDVAVPVYRPPVTAPPR